MDTNSENAARPNRSSPDVAGPIGGRMAGDGGGGGNGHGNEHPQSTREAFAAASRHLRELQDYAGYFVAAKVDGIKLSLKNAGIYAGLGVVGLIAGGAFIVVAVVQFCYGIAGALGALFGGRQWVGELITGIVLLAGIFGGTYYVLKSMTNKSRKATVDKYEARKREQRSEYGHDVHERAREQHAATAGAGAK
jgi:hypothetical protein